MTIVLASKPGLSSTTALSIPKNWDPVWFRGFINNLLKGADVRNAVGTGGLKVSGTIASPYATIGPTSGSFITSVVGTANEIAVSTVGSTATLSFAPNIVIPAPASGVALIVNGSPLGNSNGDVQINTQSGIALGILSATAPFTQMFLRNTLNSATSYTEIAMQADGTTNNFNMLLSGSNATGGALAQLAMFGAVPIYINSNGAAGITLSPTGSVTIENGATIAVTVAANAAVTVGPPSSGTSTALTVNAIASGVGIQVNPANSASVGIKILDPGANATQLRINTNNSNVLIQALGTSTGLVLQTSGGVAVNIAPAMNVTINAPTSGNSLTVTGLAGVNNPAVQVNGGTTAGQSNGITIAAGTNGSDTALNISNGAVTQSLFTVFGDGGIEAGSATGGDLGLGKINVSGGYYINGVAIGGGGSSITTLTQSGGASQVYTVPTANFVMVICIGGGGGGGSGQKPASGTTGGGGGGGAGGGLSQATFRAADLGASVTVTFSNAATGGNGGAGVTGAGVANGQNGVAGSNVNFGTLLWAYGGGAGVGGVGGSGTGGSATGTGLQALGTTGGLGGTGTGGNGTAQGAGTYGTNAYSNTGGGGGGGLPAAPAANAGGNGGNSPASGQFITLTGGLGGTAGNPGNNGSANSGTQPASGGGGGSSGAGTNSGQAGGHGGDFGGGGGGGGACLTTGATTGAGGRGGFAACIIVAW